MQQNWKRGSEEFNLNDLVDLLKNCKSITIGSDSKYFRHYTRYSTVICAIIDSGTTYWHRDTREYNMAGDIYTRIWAEVDRSMEIAFQVRDILPDIDIVVHCDINSDPRFGSHRFYDNAKGYVTGCGFEYVAKPYSWAASGVADWHTK